MSKKNKTNNIALPKISADDCPPMPKVTPPKDSEEQKDVWAFPSKSACERCGTLDTQAVSTQENTQYRRCLRAICRHSYKVIGEKVVYKSVK